MSVRADELTVIQELSRRIVDAQRNIRILDQIKWDDTVKQDFFQNKGQQLPSVDAVARTRRGPAVCENHGRRDGPTGLELE